MRSCTLTLTADAHFLPPAYLLMKSRMGPDLKSPSKRSAAAGSPLQTTSRAGAWSTPKLAAISPSPRTYGESNTVCLSQVRANTMPELRGAKAKTE